jgi:hypothetical protein
MVSACSVDFKLLSQLERQTAAHPALFELMKSEFQRLVSGAAVGHLSERTCCVVLSSAYLRFGFSSLGPAGRRMLARGLEELVGIPFQMLSDWIECVSYSILEDLNVLHVIDGTPDWSGVDHDFARILWKAFLCSSSDETAALGLSLFSGADVTLMREAAQQNIALLLAQPLDFKVEFAGADRLGSSFSSAFHDCMAQAAADHLVLLLWRIEAYACFAGRSGRPGRPKQSRSPDLDQNSDGLFLLRGCPGHAAEAADLLSGLAAVLVVLADLRWDHGGPLILEAPASLRAVVRAVKKMFNSRRPEGLTDLLRKWIGSLESVPEHVERGLAAGLLYEVRPVQGPPAYGLSSFGLRVLEPFQPILDEMCQAADSNKLVVEWPRLAEHFGAGRGSHSGEASLSRQLHFGAGIGSEIPEGGFGHQSGDGFDLTDEGVGGFARFYRELHEGKSIRTKFAMQDGSESQRGPAIEQEVKRRARKQTSRRARTEPPTRNRPRPQGVAPGRSAGSQNGD